MVSCGVPPPKSTAVTEQWFSSRSAALPSNARKLIHNFLKQRGETQFKASCVCNNLSLLLKEFVLQLLHYEIVQCVILMGHYVHLGVRVIRKMV